MAQWAAIRHTREEHTKRCANCAKPIASWKRYCWLCGLFGGQRRVTGVFKVNGEVPQDQETKHD